MRVEPELPDHPKYLRLKRRVGDFAMEALVRLWGHCQQNQRGAQWFGADAEYVELIAKWDGDPGLLHRSLIETGWLEVLADGPNGGGILVHDWEEMNTQIVNNWVNGKLGGRRKKQAGSEERNPVVNHSVTRRETQTQSGLPGISGASQKNPVVNPIPVSVYQSETQREPCQRNVTEQDVTNPNETDLAVGHHSEDAGGTPGGAQPAVPGPRYDLAERVIHFLNEKTGAEFKGTRLELDAVAACLAQAGNDFEAVKKMVARQVALWSTDGRMRQWLRPSTLFGEKFGEYFAMRDLPTDLSVDPAERRRELEEQIQKHPANRQSVFHRVNCTEEEKENLKNLRRELASLGAGHQKVSSGA